MKKTFRMMMAVAIAALTFTACEDVPEPYNNPYDGRQPSEPEVVIEPTGSGTLADPYNVAMALQVCQEVGQDGTSTDVYAKGVVTDIKSIDTSYGNAEFTISDDSKGSNSLTVYRAYGPGSKKITDENLFKVGDEVVVCGKLVNFKGNTPEFTQGCYIVSVNNNGGGGDTPTPSGEVKAVTIAEFNAAAESTDVWYQLTGTVKNLKDGDQYGNFDLEDATGSVYVYGLLSEKGGAKKLFQDLVAAKGIKEGCTLTLIGNRGSYNGKIEVTNAYFVSIEGGNTPGGNTNPEPQTGNGGVLEGNTLTVVYGDLGISSIDSPVKLVDGTTLTFSKEDGKNNPIYHESTKIVRMYAHNSVTINAGSKKIASVVFNYDTYQGTAYCGNDELYGEAGGNKLTPAKDDKTVSFTGVNASTLKVMNDLSTGNSGGVQFRCTGLVITFAQ